jgi:prepilin-type processing-associated H-X9-DG protein
VLLLAGAVSFVLADTLWRGREICHRGSICLSNLKRISLASIQYADDHEGRLPPMEGRWTEALEPYLKNSQIFVCPQSDDHDRYAMNPFLLGHRLEDIPDKLRQWTVLAYDSDGVGPARRHQDGYNAAFADGHVKWISPSHPPVVWNPWEPQP